MPWWAISTAHRVPSAGPRYEVSAIRVFPGTGCPAESTVLDGHAPGRGHTSWAGQRCERRPPIGDPLEPARPPRRRTADFLPIEFGGIGRWE